jgi:hypothetical protein
MNILYIFVEIIKKSTTMKNTIFTLILTVSTLVGFSQVFTLTSNYQYFFEYPKNERLDSLFLNEKLMSYGVSEKEINYKFDLPDSVLTMTFFRDSLVTTKFKIVEVSSFLDSNVVISCVILGDSGTLYDVISTISMETNNVDLVYISNYNDTLNRGGYHPKMTYVFND